MAALLMVGFQVVFAQIEPNVPPPPVLGKTITSLAAPQVAPPELDVMPVLVAVTVVGPVVVVTVVGPVVVVTVVTGPVVVAVLEPIVVTIAPPAP
jgi:hypothetical protein